jgi:hypothetical protein
MWRLGVYMVTPIRRLVGVYTVNPTSRMRGVFIFTLMRKL